MSMSDIYGLYMPYNFFIILDGFECDGLHDEKWLRSCEELDSLSENRLIRFDQQAICN